MLIAVLCCVTVAAAQDVQTSKPPKKQQAGHQEKPVSFKKDVVPVLKKYCLPCHTEDQMNPSELYLDTHDGILAGGKHGVAVLPGKPDSSLLITKFNEKPVFGDRMPLKRKTPFPADTLAILKAWIRAGAKND
jgi:hypothetical protein